MPHQRAFRFAAEIHRPLPGATWGDSARELEDLGYSTAFFPDHFDEGPGPIAAMAAAAAGLFGTDRESLCHAPMALFGSANEIAETLRARRERWGYSYIVIPGDKIRDFAPIVASLTGT